MEQIVLPVFLYALAFIGVVVIGWRKGWRYLALLPAVALVGYTVYAYLSHSIDPASGTFLTIQAGLTLVMVAFGVFGPKKPITLRAKRQIMELEKKVQELTNKLEEAEKRP